jgi:phosphocarrier protein
MSGTSRRQSRISTACGFNLRAAYRFVELSRQFQAQVRVQCDGRTADGRSILELMTLAAVCGARLEIETTAQDAEAAAASLCALIDQAATDDGEARPLVV